MCTGLSLRIYAIETGEMLRELRVAAPDALSPVTGFSIDPTNQFRVICAYFNGIIAIFDWTDGSVLREIKIEQSHIKHLLVINKQGQVNIYYTEQSGINIHCIVLSKFLATVSSTLILMQKGIMALACSSSNEYFDLFALTKVGVLCITDNKVGESLDISGGYIMAACQSHLAVGDKEGRIFVFDLSNLSICQSLRWHAQQVRALSWALNGAYLLSGGAEGVLVLWRVETGQKQYLPRLTADAILGLSVSNDSTLYVATLSHAIKILNALDLTSKLEISGLCAAPRKKSAVSSHTPCFYDTARSTLYFASIGLDIPVLQAYDVIAEKQLLSFPVNQISYAGPIGHDDSNVSDASITHIALSKDRKWLATLDEWSPPISEQPSDRTTDVKEVFLKFWTFLDGHWKLQTRIDGPHGFDQPTCGLVVTPESAFLTAGGDRKIRIWKQYYDKDQDIRAWLCHYEIDSVRQPSCMCLNEDASVLAVGSKNQGIIELYRTTTREMFHRLKLESLGLDQIGLTGHHIIYKCVNKVVSWSLLTGKFSWAMQFPNADGKFDCKDDKIAYISKAQLIVFDASSPIPEMRTELTRNAVALQLIGPQECLVVTEGGQIYSFESTLPNLVFTN